MLRHLLKEIFHLLCFFIVDGILINFFRSPRYKNGVVIIRLDTTGDFYLWLDSAGVYRSLYPDDKITLLGNRPWVAVAEQFPYWDEIWEVDREKMYINPVYRLKTLVKLRHAGFKTAIQAVVTRRLSDDDAVIRASGAEERIGASGDLTNSNIWKNRIGNLWYTKLVPVSSGRATLLRSNTEFVRGMGMENSVFHLPSIPLIHINPNVENEAISSLNDFYILVPGARALYRRWPISRFVAITDRIFNQYGITGVIWGGPDEEDLGRNIIQTSKNARLINMVGKITVPEVTEIIRSASFLIGNETSGIHIAAATGTPSICILGGGHFGRFVPYDSKLESDRPLPQPVYHYMDCFGCNWKRPCLSFSNKLSVVPCILSITVDDVWREVRKLCDRLKAE